MGHSDRVGDQRLNRAQVLSKRPQLDRIHKPFGCVDTADDLEPDHRTESRGLALGEVVLRERFQTGVLHHGDLWVGVEEASDLHCIVRLAVHALRQGLDALQGEPGDLGRHDGAGGVLHIGDPVVQLRCGRHHRSPDGGVVAVEVLGGRVHRQVGTEIEGPLVVRAEDRVVHRVGHGAGLGDVGNGGDVAVLQRRIGGGLGEDERGVVPHRGGNGGGIGCVDEGELDTEPGEDRGGEAVGPSVGHVGDHGVIAGVEEGYEHRVDGGHAGGESCGVRTVLEDGDLLFPGAHGRVART